MERIIETERLYLRPFMLKDASAMFKMNQNPNELEFSGEQKFKNIEAAEIFIKNYNYDDHKLGLWVVCGKKQGEFLGWCGLKKNKEKEIIELKYRFAEKHWNKGFATEACKGVISYAFNVLRVQKIYAFINEKNNKSINVILKLGFTKLQKTKTEIIYLLENRLITVKKIDPKETYLIRQKVLRQGKPINTCYFEGDKNEATFHLGLFYYGELIGIATFMENSNKLFDTTKQYQLRGMAVLQQFQGKKFGNVLLENGIKELEQRKVSLLWCNARENALNFYSKFNFKTIGNPFDIPNIGKHYTMYLSLT